MAQQGSYQAETFAVGLDHEIRRLNAQVDLFWRSEASALRRAGLTDGMDVLDCGCGPGRLIELLNQEFDGLKLTGLEIDPTLVTAAKEYLTRAGLSEFEIVHGSAEHTNLPPESFDFIVMRLVLEHVVDPVAALEELKKVLRPGGRIMIISNDFEFHLRTEPPVPELDDLYDAYIASRRADGGNPTIGRRVPVILRDAGLNPVGFEAGVAHNHLEGDPAFLLAEGAGIPAKLVETGYLDEEVFERLVASWKAMLEAPDHSIMRPLFVAVGEKPADGVVHDKPTAAHVPEAAGFEELDYIAPSTDLERDIAQIWADVIGLERVGVNQNFFDLGGTSLMLEQVQMRLDEQLGTELPLTALFQHPTVEALAKSLASESAAGGGGGDAPVGAYEQTSTRRDAASRSRQARRRRDALLRRPPTDE